jgi:hypothetical protein
MKRENKTLLKSSLACLGGFVFLYSVFFYAGTQRGKVEIDNAMHEGKRIEYLCYHKDKWNKTDTLAKFHPAMQGIDYVVRKEIEKDSVDCTLLYNHTRF